MIFVYEKFQLIIYYILKFFLFFIRSKKAKRFVELRNPKLFFSSIIEAKKIIDNDVKNQIEYDVFWFHVSSAGEMEQAIPVARKLSENLGVRYFLTYYSPSAEPFLNNFPYKIGYSGLPLDNKKYFNLALNSLNIKKIFFVRYDLWPSLFNSCLDNKVEINLISATLNKSRVGFFAFLSEYINKNYYKNITNIFAVNNHDAQYFMKFSTTKNVFLAGDAKWSRALERANNSSKLKNDKFFNLFYYYCLYNKLILNKKCLVFGSPHQIENNIALQCEGIKDKIFMIYVPHETDHKICNKLLHDFLQAGLKVEFFSKIILKLKDYCERKSIDINVNYNIQDNIIGFKNYNNLDLLNKIQNFNFEFLENYEIIIFDKIGYLAELYELGDIAIVGGGFDGQIHNVLEPAAHGIPVLIGNNFLKSYEASELIEHGAAISFQNSNDLFQFLVQWVSLEGEEVDAMHPVKRLSLARDRAVKLFKNIPDTSEIILNTFLKGKKSSN
ncbi:3-deoxy-D-manno-octulosonic acid transferase [Spirobacillus cienkowskii]|uniref:3-deoxy-D-manno-octulosonic acid transferase n=1 Tax=Spirobacillus cienkowskii TaxID=495820 RepID=UPI0030CF15E1